jgi:hypothetical protein
MRKVGTLSSALGFIFLGTLMIIKNTNEGLATEMLKWWPLLIIILGCEIIFGFDKSKQQERVKINGLVIPVIGVFLLVSAFHNVNIKVENGIQWLKKPQNLGSLIAQLDNLEDSNYKVLKTSRILNNVGSDFIFETNNGEVTIKNSTDGKITLNASVYVGKGSKLDKYDIKEENQTAGYKVEINDEDVRKVKIEIYLPSNLNFIFKGNNSKIVSEDDRNVANFDIETNNGSIEVNNAQFVKIKTSNAKIDIKNVEMVDINSSNASIDLEGKVPNIDVVTNNSVIDVDNEVCESISIKANSGSVKFNTDDNNVEVNLVLDRGTSKINDERRVNGGISKVFGQGKGKVEIEMNNGIINFQN